MASDLDPNLISEIVEELKSFYVMYRKSLLGQTSFTGSADAQFDRLWEKLAVAIIENEADPIDWIVACFEAYKPYPYINQLVGETAKNIWLNYSKSIDTDIVRAMQLQSDTYKTQLNLNKTDRAVLLDPLLPLSALFRYIIAIQLDLADVAKKFYHEASLQYYLKKGYSKVLKDLDYNLWTKIEALLARKN